MRKLSESVWGDLRKKSLGQETRLEDNVNDLDLKGFTQYLKDKYPETATTQTKSSQIRTDGISSIYIPILPYGYNAAYELVYKFEKRRLLIHDRYNSNSKLPSKLKFLIKSYMFTTFDSDGESEFFTKQGKPIETNEQVIEIIEMILDNYQGEDLMISKKISESVWGNIRKKSMGQETRIEEDVNHMDFDTFADYIKDNYSEKGDWFYVSESSDKKSRHIEIDIISGINLSFNVVDGKIYNILITNNANKYIDVPGLKKIFNVNILSNGIFSIIEKDLTKSNNTFVKLIEFFLEKKTNESVWGDIRKKSLGQETRIEEDVNSLSIDGFYEYLLSTYKHSSFNLNRAFDGISNFESGDMYDIYIPFERMKTDSDRFMKLYLTYKKKKNKYTNICFHFDVLKYNPELEHILKEKFIVEKSEALRQVDIYIKESRDIKNSDIIDLLDILLANAEYPALEKQEKP